jgi:hypothetical protein
VNGPEVTVTLMTSCNHKRFTVIRVLISYDARMEHYSSRPGVVTDSYMDGGRWILNEQFLMKICLIMMNADTLNFLRHTTRTEIHCRQTKFFMTRYMCLYVLVMQLRDAVWACRSETEATQHSGLITGTGAMAGRTLHDARLLKLTVSKFFFSWWGGSDPSVDAYLR